MTGATWIPEAEVGDGWLVHLPKVELIRDRAAWLADLVRGATVVHVGFVDQGCEQTNANERWLHARLAEAAQSIVGLDVVPEAVEAARSLGYSAEVADCTDIRAVEQLGLEPAAFVVLGEVIEHVERPGDLLRAVRPLVQPGGSLVVTTPNAHRPIDLLFAALRRASVHPDHVAVYTPPTLVGLLHRCGWVVDRQVMYESPGSGSRPAGLKEMALRSLSVTTRAAARRFPYLADGIAVIAKPSR